MTSTNATQALVWTERPASMASISSSARAFQDTLVPCVRPTSTNASVNPAWMGRHASIFSITIRVHAPPDSQGTSVRLMSTNAVRLLVTMAERALMESTCTSVSVRPGSTAPRAPRISMNALSSPCLNNATCLNLIAKFSCVCPTGFQGQWIFSSSNLVTMCRLSPIGHIQYDAKDGYFLWIELNFWFKRRRLQIDQRRHTTNELN